MGSSLCFSSFLAVVVLLVNCSCRVQAPESADRALASSLNAAIASSIPSLESPIKSAIIHDVSVQDISVSVQIAPTSTESELSVLPTVAPATPHEDSEDVASESSSSLLPPPAQTQSKSVPDAVPSKPKEDSPQNDSSQVNEGSPQDADKQERATKPVIVEDIAEKEASSEQKKVEEAPKKVEPAPKKIESAPKKVEPLPMKIETTPQNVEPTPKKPDPTPKKVETAPQKVEIATKDEQPAPKKDEPPPKTTEHPQVPTQSVQVKAPQEPSSPTDQEEPGKEDLPSFVEFYKQRMQEEEEKEQKKKQNTASTSKGVKLKERKKNNYASLDCGAKILDHNPEAANAISILMENKDVYMLNPCSANIWFTVELCDVVSIKTIEIANFELFSSTPESFKIYVSGRYPTREWTPLGTFHARDVREVQRFPLEEGVYAKYMKIELISRFGSEHYCPWSLLRVYGTSMVEEFEDHESVVEHEDSDDDEVLPIQPGISNVASGDKNEKNILSSATDAVIDFVKKAAQKITGGDNKNVNASINGTENVTNVPQGEASTSSIISTITSIIGSASVSTDTQAKQSIVVLINDEEDDSSVKNNTSSQNNTTESNTTSTSDSKDSLFDSYQKTMKLVYEDKCTLSEEKKDHCLHITPCELLSSILGPTTFGCYLGKILYSSRQYTNFSAMYEAASMRSDRKVVGRKKKKDIVQKIVEDDEEDDSVKGDGVSSEAGSDGEKVSNNVSETELGISQGLSSNVAPESVSGTGILSSEIGGSLKPSMEAVSSVAVKSQSKEKTPELLPSVAVDKASQAPEIKSVDVVQPSESTDITKVQESSTEEAITKSVGESAADKEHSSIEKNQSSSSSQTQTIKQKHSTDKSQPPVDTTSRHPVEPKVESKEVENVTAHQKTPSTEHVDILEIKLDNDNEGTALPQVDEQTAEAQKSGTASSHDKAAGNVNTSEPETSDKQPESTTSSQLVKEQEKPQPKASIEEEASSTDSLVKEKETSSIAPETRITATSSAETVHVKATAVLSSEVKVAPPNVPVEVIKGSQSETPEKRSPGLENDPSLKSDLVSSSGKLPESSSPGATQGPLSSNQKESIFMRLSNKIKALEMNLTLSNAYMEQISKKYKKSLDDMQKTFEKKMAAVNEGSKKADQEILQQRERIEKLEMQVEQLTQVVSNLTQQMNSINKEVMERHVVGMFLQAAFVLLLILLMRRCLPQARTQHVPETQVIVPHSYCNGTVTARDQPEEAQQPSQHKNIVPQRGVIKHHSAPANLSSSVDKLDLQRPSTLSHFTTEHKRKRRKRSKVLHPEEATLSKQEEGSDESPSNILSGTAGLLFSGAAGMLSSISGTLLPKTGEDIPLTSKERRRLNRIRSLDLSDVDIPDVVPEALVPLPPPPPPPPPLPLSPTKGSYKAKKNGYSQKESSYKVYSKDPMDTNNKHLPAKDSHRMMRYNARVGGLSNGKAVQARY